MAGPTRLKVDSYGASSIDAYLEYKRIVGDDDGGVLFTPEQYEAYKNKVIPQRMKNRLFASWGSPVGIECKMVGPETMCFCRHRYRQHKTDFEVIPRTRPIKLQCGIRGCECNSFEYVPLNGSRTIKCKCKHFADEHGERSPHKCKNVECGCKSFRSSYTCGCGEPTYAHKMIVETKEERAKRGRPVGMAVPYQAMGGLTGFSSLADGYRRLDPSGIGAPSKEFLQKPIGPGDHPFLRSHQKLQPLAIEGSSASASQLVRRQTTEEEDMAYFEKRYKDRLRLEKEKARENAQKVLAIKRERANGDRAKVRAVQSSKTFASHEGRGNEDRAKMRAVQSSKTLASHERRGNEDRAKMTAVQSSKTLASHERRGNEDRAKMRAVQSSKTLASHEGRGNEDRAKMRAVQSSKTLARK